MSNADRCKRYYEKNREKILEKKRNPPPGYNSWKMMKQRCDNQNRQEYHRYGGRGISYTAQWASFNRFISDMGEPPTATHTIERIDNDMNYTKENCRWETRRNQASNTSISYEITIDGKTKTLSGWAEYFGIPISTVSSRINRSGWSIKKALGLGE
jgi:hypothetical protein